MTYSRLLLCLLCLSLSLPPAFAAPGRHAEPKTRIRPEPPQGPDAPLGTFDLRDTRIHDVMRLVAELSAREGAWDDALACIPILVREFPAVHAAVVELLRAIGGQIDD